MRIQWNLSIKGTLNKGHFSNDDTVCSPNHIELCTNREVPHCICVWGGGGGEKDGLMVVYRRYLGWTRFVQLRMNCCFFLRYQDNEQHEEAVRDYEKLLSMERTRGAYCY